MTTRAITTTVSELRLLQQALDVAPDGSIRDFDTTTTGQPSLGTQEQRLQATAAISRPSHQSALPVSRPLRSFTDSLIDRQKGTLESAQKNLERAEKEFTAIMEELDDVTWKAPSPEANAKLTELRTAAQVAAARLEQARHAYSDRLQEISGK